MEPPLYSQGFNFSSFVQNGVDPRTGQYTCAISLYESPSEARNCPLLQLSTNYNPLSIRNIGLGQGWSFNLSSYSYRQSNNRTLLLFTGEHYRITETPTKVFVDDQKLQSFYFAKKVTNLGRNDQTVTYQVTYKSGLIEILSNVNNLYDTTVPLVWEAFGERPRLARVQEGEQNLVKINYTSSRAKIVRNPNTTEISTISFILANSKLIRVRLLSDNEENEQNEWKFTYENFDQGITGLSTVTSPTEGHSLPVGAPYRSIPYVISYTNNGKNNLYRALIIYHLLPNKLFKDQPAQYHVSRTQTSYYIFDNVKTDRVYYKAVGEMNGTTGETLCPADPNGFQRYLKEVIVTPATSGLPTPTRSKFYTYRQLPVVTASLCPVDYFVVAGQTHALENGQCTLSTQLDYATTANYLRLNNQLIKTTQATFFNGITTQDKTTYSIFSGRIIARKNTAGKQAVFTYDGMGRLIKSTTAPGTPYEATRQREYTVITDNHDKTTRCCITVTDAKGMKTRYITDGLEKVLRIESQDDDGHYNARGSIVERTAPTQQCSSRLIDYDNWGRQYKVKQDGGLTLILFIDPITLTTLSGIEGESMAQTELDLFGHPIYKLLLYSNNIENKERFSYNNLGRLVQHTDQSGNTKQLYYNCFDRVTQTVAAPLPVSIAVGRGNAIATQTFDGLNLARYSYRENEPVPTHIITPKLDKLDLTYDAFLGYAPTSLIGSDNKYSYQYDTQTAAIIYPGRLEYYTDIEGQLYKIYYDQYRRPCQLAQGKLKVTFSYNSASRLLKGYVKNEDNNLSLITSLNSEILLYRLVQCYNAAGLVIARDIKNKNSNLLRHESFSYDNLKRLRDYQYGGNKADLPSNKTSKRLKHPCQVISIINTYLNYLNYIKLPYNGRILEYNSLNRLITIRNAYNSSRILSKYQYNASDTQLLYRGDILIGVRTGDSQVTYACSTNDYWGQTTKNTNSGSEKIELWASDYHQSVLASVAASETVRHHRYTPYGFTCNGESIGFNGQWRDPVTGCYHLGNGYRVYNPVLKRFHSPDGLSPFSSGEINAYTYCLGDPINLIDPTGHFSIFGLKFTTRDLVLMGAGTIVGIIVGIATGGAGIAIAVGISIAAGVVSDVAFGIGYDIIDGRTPTWKSIATDAGYGLLGGLAGEGIGRILGKAWRLAKPGINKAFGRSGSYAVSSAAEHGAAEGVSGLRLASEGMNMNGNPQMFFFDALLERPGHTGLMTHGDWNGNLVDSRGILRRASDVARTEILPRLEQRELVMRTEDTFTLMACYSYPRSGEAVARVLQRPVRCFDGPLEQPRMPRWRNQDEVVRALETRNGITTVWPTAKPHVVPWYEPMDVDIPFQEPMDVDL
ncbi:hypothetical protein F4777DRAFT_593379 [Nemania sp. FL0916]|nr:hypothetical protein F4777DRAFT_593379 [Nemania sp. FL0916]